VPAAGHPGGRRPKRLCQRAAYSVREDAGVSARVEAGGACRKQAHDRFRLRLRKSRACRVRCLPLVPRGRQPGGSRECRMQGETSSASSPASRPGWTPVRARTPAAAAGPRPCIVPRLRHGRTRRRGIRARTRRPACAGGAGRAAAGRSPLPTGLDLGALEELAALGHHQTVLAGEDVVREGEPGDRGFVHGAHESMPPPPACSVFVRRDSHRCRSRAARFHGEATPSSEPEAA
jgi:hypothetical protein